MRFLLFCCFNEKQWADLSAPQRDGIMRDYGALVENLHRSGQHLAGGQLMPAATAQTVRGKDGKAAVTDGPFAETKEQLGGYHLLECRNLDEALAIAKRIPTIPYGGTVEVRALINPSQETA